MAVRKMNGMASVAGLRAQRGEEREAVHDRHHDVGDDEVRHALLDRCERALAVLRHAHVEPLAEAVLEQAAERLVVLDDEDVGRRHGASGAGTWRGRRRRRRSRGARRGRPPRVAARSRRRGLRGGRGARRAAAPVPARTRNEMRWPAAGRGRPERSASVQVMSISRPRPRSDGAGASRIACCCSTCPAKSKPTRRVLDRALDDALAVGLDVERDLGRRSGKAACWTRLATHSWTARRSTLAPSSSSEPRARRSRPRRRRARGPRRWRGRAG